MRRGPNRDYSLEHSVSFAGVYFNADVRNDALKRMYTHGTLPAICRSWVVASSAITLRGERTLSGWQWSPDSREMPDYPRRTIAHWYDISKAASAPCLNLES